MSKESIRKQVSLNINLDISSLEASIKREEQNLKAIKRMSIPQELMIKKTNNMLECIQKWTTELENLKKKNEDILAGELDKEIINDNPEKNKKKAKAKLKPMLIKDKIKPKHKHYQKFEFDAAARDANQYASYLKVCESLPDYMRKNLREMTNNKGYIWRGCWFFGELPSNPYENTVVFEKCRGVLRIHETDRRTHKIYEKIGSERKNLISTIPKKHKL